MEAEGVGAIVFKGLLILARGESASWEDFAQDHQQIGTRPMVAEKQRPKFNDGLVKLTIRPWARRLIGGSGLTEGLPFGGILKFQDSVGHVVEPTGLSMNIQGIEVTLVSAEGGQFAFARVGIKEAGSEMPVMKF